MRRAWRWSLLVPLSMVVTSPVHAQRVAAQQTVANVCDEWCFEISYPGGYRGYACESGYEEYGDWMCTATASDCTLDHCRMVLITGPGFIELATYVPCRDQRSTVGSRIHTVNSRVPTLAYARTTIASLQSGGTSGGPGL